MQEELSRDEFALDEEIEGTEEVKEGEDEDEDLEEEGLGKIPELEAEEE